MAVRNWSWINSSFHHCQKLKRPFAAWELEDFSEALTHFLLLSVLPTPIMAPGQSQIPQIHD